MLTFSFHHQEESADEQGGLETDEGDADDTDDQEESEDEGLSTAITSPTDASMLEMASNTNDTNAICEDSNTEASETPSFPTEEPSTGKTTTSTSFKADLRCTSAEEGRKRKPQNLRAQTRLLVLLRQKVSSAAS